MSESARKKGHDAIRDAAWQGASASGLSRVPFGDPPLSSAPAGAASTRRQARAQSGTAPRRRLKAGPGTRAAKATRPPTNGHRRPDDAVPSRFADSAEFEKLIGEDWDWRDNPSAAARF